MYDRCSAQAAQSTDPWVHSLGWIYEWSLVRKEMRSNWARSLEKCRNMAALYPDSASALLLFSPKLWFSESSRANSSEAASRPVDVSTILLQKVGGWGRRKLIELTMSWGRGERSWWGFMLLWWWSWRPLLRWRRIWRQGWRRVEALNECRHSGGHQAWVANVIQAGTRLGLRVHWADVHQIHQGQLWGHAQSTSGTWKKNNVKPVI